MHQPGPSKLDAGDGKDADGTRGDGSHDEPPAWEPCHAITATCPRTRRHPSTATRPTESPPTGHRPTASRPTGNRPTASPPTASPPTANRPTARPPTANRTSATSGRPTPTS